MSFDGSERQDLENRIAELITERDYNVERVRTQLVTIGMLTTTRDQLVRERGLQQDRAVRAEKARDQNLEMIIKLRATIVKGQYAATESQKTTVNNQREALNLLNKRYEDVRRRIRLYETGVAQRALREQLRAKNKVVTEVLQAYDELKASSETKAKDFAVGDTVEYRASTSFPWRRGEVVSISMDGTVTVKGGGHDWNVTIGPRIRKVTPKMAPLKKWSIRAYGSSPDGGTSEVLISGTATDDLINQAVNLLKGETDDK